MTTEIRFFALKSKKEKGILDRGQNGFQCEDNNNNNKQTYFPSIYYLAVLLLIVLKGLVKLAARQTVLWSDSAICSLYFISWNKFLDAM